jgi:hypothetical protein
MLLLGQATAQLLHLEDACVRIEERKSLESISISRGSFDARITRPPVRPPTVETHAWNPYTAAVRKWV